MKNNKLAIMLFGIFLYGCTINTSTNDKINVSEKNDSLKYVQIVADLVMGDLKDKVIFDRSIQENGDFQIVFGDDTTDIESGGIIKEYYTIEKKTLIIGDIDMNKYEDFVIRTLWGSEMGNSYGFEWYILLNKGNKWAPIENQFGGGKFSNIENITSIKNGNIITDFFLLDKETFLHEEKSETRLYEIIDDELISAK